MSKKIKKTGKIAIVLGIALALVLVYSVSYLAKAAEIANRKITLSDSRTSQAGVDYVFEGDHTASTTRCIEVDFCTTATGTCTAPTGLTTASGDKGDSGDWSGWTYANWTFSSVDANTAQLTNSTGQDGGNDYKCVFGNITNPSSSGTAFARIYTYSDATCTTEVDSGNVAFAIVSGVSVSATVAESLTFTIEDSALGFGEISTGSIRYATDDESGSNSEPGAGDPSQLTLSTNAADGATITIEDVGNGSTAAGLYNSAASKLISATAPSAVAAGTESYAPYGKNAASGLSIATGFQSNGGTAVSRDPQTFITASGPLSTNNTADLALKAGVSATTEAGSYSDTIILIATPQY